jgi:hypothetical protein
MPAVTFEPVTKTLIFVPEYFLAAHSPRFVSWSVDVAAGKHISVGSVLATITWDTTGEKETIESPVAGTIKSVNDTIDHTLLHKKVQVALELSVVDAVVPAPPGPVQGA